MNRSLNMASSHERKATEDSHKTPETQIASRIALWRHVKVRQLCAAVSSECRLGVMQKRELASETRRLDTSHTIYLNGKYEAVLHKLLAVIESTSVGISHR